MECDKKNIESQMKHTNADTTREDCPAPTTLMHYNLQRLASIDPVRLLHIIEDYDNMVQRMDILERAQKVTTAVDGRRNSLEIGTPGKGGVLKHYNDPSVSAEENDRLLAEQARVFLNGGGTLPENFSPRIRAMAEAIEKSRSNGGA